MTPQAVSIVLWRITKYILSADIALRKRWIIKEMNKLINYIISRIYWRMTKLTIITSVVAEQYRHVFAHPITKLTTPDSSYSPQNLHALPGVQGWVCVEGWDFSRCVGLISQRSKCGRFSGISHPGKLIRGYSSIQHGGGNHTNDELLSGLKRNMLWSIYWPHDRVHADLLGKFAFHGEIQRMKEDSAKKLVSNLISYLLYYFEVSKYSFPRAIESSQNKCNCLICPGLHLFLLLLKFFLSPTFFALTFTSKLYATAHYILRSSKFIKHLIA